jgi:RNA polymerase subunit RPABC4/transcription elongation factor Spt4
MIWSGDRCGTILPLRKMPCPNCKKSAMSWLQMLVIAVLPVPALFLLVKFL